MTISSGIDIQLPTAPPTTDPELYQQLLILYNSIRNLHIAVSDLTGNSGVVPNPGDYPPAETVTLGNYSRMYVKSPAAVAYGDLISFWGMAVDVATGLPQITVADAYALTYVSSGSRYFSQHKMCTGFVSSPGGIVAGGYGEVTVGPSIYTANPGVLPGVHYYLQASTIGTAGKLRTGNIGSGAVTDVGDYRHFHQLVGVGLQPGVMWFNPSFQTVGVKTPYAHIT